MRVRTYTKYLNNTFEYAYSGTWVPETITGYSGTRY